MCKLQLEFNVCCTSHYRPKKNFFFDGKKFKGPINTEDLALNKITRHFQLRN